MRVLSVIGTLGLGGAETQLARVAHAIRTYDVDMEVCALRPEGPNLSLLNETGIPVHGTPYLKQPFGSNTVMLLRTIDVIRRIVKGGNFDIVQTYLHWADVLGVTAARLARCRRIIVSRVALHSWNHPPRVLSHGLEQFSDLMANEVIANSKTVLKDAEIHEPLLPARRGVVYSGVNIAEYEPAQPRSEGQLRLLTLGALAPRKGQEYAIEALALLTRSGVDAVLELVGAGPDEAMLRKQAAAAGLGTRVKFSGQHRDPRPFLMAADIFILPSRQEGFANALIEAMASALPVVATDVGGNAEALVDGEGGRIVPPRQPAAIAAAVIELARDRNVLAQMGRMNRARIAGSFSLDASARQLAAWYMNAPSPRIP